MYSDTNSSYGRRVVTHEAVAMAPVVAKDLQPLRAALGEIKNRQTDMDRRVAFVNPAAVQNLSERLFRIEELLCSRDPSCRGVLFPRGRASSRGDDECAFHRGSALGATDDPSAVRERNQCTSCAAHNATSLDSANATFASSSRALWEDVWSHRMSVACEEAQVRAALAGQCAADAAYFASFYWRQSVQAAEAARVVRRRALGSWFFSMEDSSENEFSEDGEHGVITTNRGMAIFGNTRSTSQQRVRGRTRQRATSNSRSEGATRSHRHSPLEGAFDPNAGGRVEMSPGDTWWRRGTPERDANALSPMTPANDRVVSSNNEQDAGVTWRSSVLARTQAAPTASSAQRVTSAAADDTAVVSGTRTRSPLMAAATTVIVSPLRGNTEANTDTAESPLPLTKADRSRQDGIVADARSPVLSARDARWIARIARCVARDAHVVHLTTRAADTAVATWTAAHTVGTRAAEARAAALEAALEAAEDAWPRRVDVAIRCAIADVRGAQDASAHAAAAARQELVEASVEVRRDAVAAIDAAWRTAVADIKAAGGNAADTLAFHTAAAVSSAASVARMSAARSCSCRGGEPSVPRTPWPPQEGSPPLPEEEDCGVVLAAESDATPGSSSESHHQRGAALSDRARPCRSVSPPVLSGGPSAADVSTAVVPEPLLPKGAAEALPPALTARSAVVPAPLDPPCASTRAAERDCPSSIQAAGLLATPPADTAREGSTAAAVAEPVDGTAAKTAATPVSRLMALAGETTPPTAGPTRTPNSQVNADVRNRVIPDTQISSGAEPPLPLPLPLRRSSAPEHPLVAQSPASPCPRTPRVSAATAAALRSLGLTAASLTPQTPPAAEGVPSLASAVTRPPLGAVGLNQLATTATKCVVAPARSISPAPSGNGSVHARGETSSECGDESRINSRLTEGLVAAHRALGAAAEKRRDHFRTYDGLDTLSDAGRSQSAVVLPLMPAMPLHLTAWHKPRATNDTVEKHWRVPEVEDPTDPAAVFLAASLAVEAAALAHSGAAQISPRAASTGGGSSTSRTSRLQQPPENPPHQRHSSRSRSGDKHHGSGTRGHVDFQLPAPQPPSHQPPRVERAARPPVEMSLADAMSLIGTHQGSSSYSLSTATRSPAPATQPSVDDCVAWAVHDLQSGQLLRRGVGRSL